MHTIFLSLLISICIASAAGWSRGASFQERFHSKRADLDSNEERLIEQARSLLRYYEKRQSDWQRYIDDQLVGTGNINQAAIIGVFDGTTWATSADFSLKPGEGTQIVNLFKNPQTVFASGVTVNGVKYIGIKGNEHLISGKKGATGVVLVKTGQAIIIGVYNERQQPGNAADTVERLSDYLTSNGY